MEREEGRLLWLEREQKKEDSLETDEYLGGPVPCLLPDLAIFRGNNKSIPQTDLDSTKTERICALLSGKCQELEWGITSIKFYWRSHAHLYTKCLWLLLHDNGRVEDPPKMFTICPFSGHNLPTHVQQNNTEDKTTGQHRQRGSEKALW